MDLLFTDKQLNYIQFNDFFVSIRQFLCLDRLDLEKSFKLFFSLIDIFHLIFHFLKYKVNG